MSVPKRQKCDQTFYGREALRRLREQQGECSQAGAPGPEPEALPTPDKDPPAPLPSGMGFAVAMPLRNEENRVPAPWRLEDAVSIIRPSLPATVVQQVGTNVVFSYVVQDLAPSEANGQAELDIVWRVRLAIRLKAAALGWVLPEQTLRFEEVPTDRDAVASAGSSGRVYTLPEISVLLDQVGIPTREQHERKIAEWRERYSAPELIIDAEDLVIEADAALPDGILQPLLDRDPEFSATWLRQRTDLPDRVEAYERELTRILAGHKFEAEQIVNALIQWRRLQGMKPDLRVRHFRQMLSQDWRGTAEPIRGTPQQRTARRDRRQLCVAANDAEQAIFEGWARREGQSISNLIRLKFGMPPTYAGRPDPIQEARREDWIYETLLELGIDPAPYFPQD